MNLRQFGLLVLLGLIWGSSFMFIKVALPTVPPFTIVFVRTFLAGLVLYAVVKIRGRRMPPPERSGAPSSSWGSSTGPSPIRLSTGVRSISRLDWGLSSTP